MAAYCYHCGGELQVGPKVAFREECPACGRDVHSCVNCGFYDPGAHNQCREPQAEWVTDREKANRCEYFRASSRRPGGRDRAAQARAKLDSLFRKEPEDG